MKEIIAKIILMEKNFVEGLTSPDVKTYYEGTEIKTMGHLDRIR